MSAKKGIKKPTYMFIEDKRKVELRAILVSYYVELGQLDDLYDLLKLDDKKRDVNSYKVNLLRTVLEQHRDNIYILERLYNVLGIQELKIINDSSIEC